MRILIVASFIPFPPDSGARIRTWEIARRMQRTHEVTFGFHVRGEADQDRAEAVRRQGFTVVTGHINTGAGAIWTAAREVLSGGVPLFALRRSRELEMRLAQLHAARPFDVIQIEHFELAGYARLLEASGETVRAMILHDVLSVAYARMARIEANPLWRLWRAWNARQLAKAERKLLGTYDACITVSSRDSAAIGNCAHPGARVQVLPNCVDFTTKVFLPEPDPAPPVLLFVGLFVHPPNADAARWIVDEILPLVRETHPDCSLELVGDDPLRTLASLVGRPGVNLAGRADELEPCYRRCDVAVVPLRAGGGTRLKILEAMAFGRAVVSTTVGAEGLEARHGEHLLLADTPRDFARAVTELLDNRALRQRLRKNARALVERRYSWDDCAQAHLTLYADLLAGKRAPALQHA